MFWSHAAVQVTMGFGNVHLLRLISCFCFIIDALYRTRPQHCCRESKPYWMNLVRTFDWVVLVECETPFNSLIAPEWGQPLWRKSSKGTPGLQFPQGYVNDKRPHEIVNKFLSAVSNWNRITLNFWISNKECELKANTFKCY